MYCGYCEKEKEEEDFSFRNKRAGKRSTRCKECQNKYSKKHYLQNKEKHNKRRYENQKRYKNRNRQFLFNYLKDKSCIDCGESDPIVLEFDHLRDKEDNISNLVARAASLSKIKREIEKCVIRCANCHRRKTARDYGWYKDYL